MCVSEEHDKSIVVCNRAVIRICSASMHSSGVRQASYLCEDILLNIILRNGHCWGSSSLTLNGLRLRGRRRTFREVKRCCGRDGAPARHLYCNLCLLILRRMQAQPVAIL